MIEVSIFQLFVIFMIILYIIKYPRVGKNSPPLVPYKIPLLGHTFDYLFNTKKFMEESRKQYGECFSIYVFGQVWTIVTGTPLNEVFKYSEHFDFLSAIQEYLPMHKFLPYNGGFTEEGNELNAKTSREHVSGKLDLNIGTVQQYLSKGMDKWIGDCNEPKAIYNIWYTANDIAALPVANILVGEEAASHEDLVNSFAKVAFDVGHLMLIPPIFSFIHPKLHEFIITLPMRFGWNPVSRHRKIVMNRLRPVVEKRLRERNKLGDNYKPYNDLLEYYMNLPDFNYTEPNNFHYHVDNLFIMVFASIHTTSRSVAVALLDIAGRPEVSNELYEEAVTIDKECNGILTVADVKRMVKLDSFVKETLRLNENLLALPHYVRSESYTFSNGYTIPRGHKVMMYLDDHLRSKEHYGDDADEFKPFRFVNKNSPATKVERSYVIFGGGRHACPGRFFAINETKVILHKLILQYKISTESGKVEDKIMIGPFAVPPSTGIVFENRVKNN